MITAVFGLIATAGICVVVYILWIESKLRKLGGADLGHPVSPGDENALLGRRIED